MYLNNKRINIGHISGLPILEYIFENSYDSFFVTDEHGKILMANPAASRLLDIPVEYLVDRNVRDLIKQGVFNKSITLKAIKQLSTAIGLIKTKSGRTLISVSTPLFDSNGNITIVITNTRDIAMINNFLVNLDGETALPEHYKYRAGYVRNPSLDNKELIISSPIMQMTFQRAKLVAGVDSTVMLTGESGTGKEVLAKYIHQMSKRSKEAFIAINCAAIPESLIESELFGYEKGAFSGANPQGKPGLFELADKGTLFLDEIAELSLSLQPKLLRVLETLEVRRLGGTTARKINIRLIVAANRNLQHLVSKNKFRDDLYYRLSVIPISIPPLRERPEDITDLSTNFLKCLNKKYGCNKVFSQKTLDAFLKYNWPGNVRELHNVVERLVITSPGNIIYWEENRSLVGNNDQFVAATCNEDTSPLHSSETLRDFLRIVEEKYIKQVLAECDGKIAVAARRLGIHRTVLWRKLKGSSI